MYDQHSLRSALAYTQSDQSLWLSLEYSMTVKILTEHHLEFLRLTGGCTGSSESTCVKMPHCWKSHVVAHMCLLSVLGCHLIICCLYPHGLHSLNIAEVNNINHDQSAPNGAVWCWSIMFVI